MTIARCGTTFLCKLNCPSPVGLPEAGTSAAGSLPLPLLGRWGGFRTPPAGPVAATLVPSFLFLLPGCG